MKILKILIITFFVNSSFVYSQNGVYTITEVYPSNPAAPILYDSVFVTNPAGVVTSHSIPYISNIAGHDSALSLIINDITSQGFGMVDVSPFIRVDFSIPSSENKTIIRWFLRELWTSNGLTILDSTSLEINIYPNPVDQELGISIKNNSLNKSENLEIIVFSLNGLIQLKKNISLNIDTYFLNVGSLTSGTYFVVLSNGKEYTKPIKFIKQKK